ncbi:hypothetical protein KCV07_g156, partial [Aureobasidium melanogenum]
MILLSTAVGLKVRSFLRKLYAIDIAIQLHLNILFTETQERLSILAAPPSTSEVPTEGADLAYSIRSIFKYGGDKEKR